MIKIILLISFTFNICFGYSKEMSHGDGSFEYPKHMFWLRNEKKYFQTDSPSLDVYAKALYI